MPKKKIEEDDIVELKDQLVYKYRPKNLDEMVLDADIKDYFIIFLIIFDNLESISVS
jgi:hypothetical protein